MRRASRPLFLRKRAPVVAGLLDAYTTAGFAALGLQRLRDSRIYSGPCLRARRSSDSAETDIGWSGSVIDSAALVAFAGAGDAFVTTWYDQFGAGNHFANATTAQQPRIVAAGVYDGFVRFDGTDDGLLCVNAAPVSAAKSVARKTAQRSAAVTGLVEYGNSDLIGSASGDTEGLVYFDGTRTSAFATQAGGGTGWSNRVYGDGEPGTPSLEVLARSGGFAGLARYRSSGSIGVFQQGDSGAGAGTGNMGSKFWRIGRRTTSSFAPMNATTFVFYDSDKGSDAVALCLLLA